MLNDAAIDAIVSHDAEPTVIVIELKPLPSDVPVPIRVRQLLKRALRDWQLKCVSVGPAWPPALQARHDDTTG